MCSISSRSAHAVSPWHAMQGSGQFAVRESFGGKSGANLSNRVVVYNVLRVGLVVVEDGPDRVWPMPTVRACTVADTVVSSWWLPSARMAHGNPSSPNTEMVSAHCQQDARR